MIKSGFVSVIGRTNSGKSSLINALLGEELCFISRKENATRRKMNVIIMHGDNQVILVDTPGLHESNKTFNQLLIEAAKKSINECDLILFVMSVKDDFSEYEKFLSLNPKVEHIVVLNKIDLVKDEYLLKKLAEFNFNAKIIPFTNKNNFYKKILLDEICKHLPVHPHFFDAEHTTDKTLKEVAAELILESIYDNLSDEVPYFCEVVVQKVIEKDNETTFFADIITDTNSHKAMLIGKEANTIKRIGIKARKRLQDLLGIKINVKLLVKQKKHWYNDEIFLKQIKLSN